MVRCEVCGVYCEDDRKALGRHLWEKHHITPNNYRVQYLRLPPKCVNPHCNKPVPRLAGGGWHKCCSPVCAVLMGEDIPI
jgi:hypothetical protein